MSTPDDADPAADEVAAPDGADPVDDGDEAEVSAPGDADPEPVPDRADAVPVLAGVEAAPDAASKVDKRAARDARRRARSPLWAKLALVLGVLVVLASGGAMVGVRLLVNQVDVAIPRAVLITHGPAPVTITGAINILMVGIDTRDDNLALGSRSDSIIIGHIPPTHDRMDMVSIPRDTWVRIPADPAAFYPGGMAKINAAFQYGSGHGGGNTGGMELLQQTIQNLTGITFQGALIVNFDGFTDIVKQLGGVWMTIDEKATSIHHGVLRSDPTVAADPFILDPGTGVPIRSVPGVRPIVYLPGYQHLSAYQALDYVRIRDGLPNSDYDRQRHQQQFVKALLQEVYQRGIDDPIRISNLLTSFGKAFQWDGGGRALSEWIFTLKGINPSGIVSIKTNGGTFDSQRIDGQSTEALTATSMDLMHAVRDDTVDEFIAGHEDWVIDS